MKNAQTNVMSIIMMIIIGVAAGLAIFWDLTVTQQTIVENFPQQFIQYSSNSTWVYLAHDKLLSGTETIFNATGTHNTLIKDSEYYINYRQGKVVVFNGTAAGTSTWNISYDYEPPAYTGGITKVILSIIPIIFAIGLLIFIARGMIGKGE